MQVHVGERRRHLAPCGTPVLPSTTRPRSLPRPTTGRSAARPLGPRSDARETPQPLPGQAGRRSRGCRRRAPSSPSSGRSRPSARPAPDAGCAPAGTRRRSRGSPPHRPRSAPRRRRAGRSCPPAWRYPAAAAARPPSGCRRACIGSPGNAPLHPPVQILQVGLQALPILGPRHPIHPRRCLRVDRPKALRSRLRLTWCSSAVNRASLSRRATSRTRSSALDAPDPALRPGRVSPAVFPSADPLPSPASATARLCSAGSQVLRDRPTSRARASQAYRLAFPERPAR